MPWCSACDRYLAPPTVRRDGTCPECGRAVDVSAHAHAPVAAGAAGGRAGERKDLPPVPWHFKLLCGALAVYLGYRFAQMGEWLLHRL